MKQNKISRHSIKVMSPTVKALKAARILRGLSRKEAADKCGWTPRVFEQIENGRSYISRERVNKILKAIGYSQEDFKSLEANPEHALALARDANKFVACLPRKPRRNFYKRITKEARVIRILRKKAQLSQYQASDLCGYANSIFGQIENPRSEIRRAVMSLKNNFYENFDAQLRRPVLARNSGLFLITSLSEQ